MVPAKETAEEQLLRMIEGPAGPRPPRPSWRDFSPEHLLEQLREKAGPLWRWILPSQAEDRFDALLWRLHITERFFWMLLGGLGLYLVIDLFVMQMRPPVLVLPPTPAASLGATATSGRGVDAEDHLKPLADYREALVTRNPFGLSAHKAGSGSTGENSSKRLAELTSTLTVVGINRGRTPEALIEDSAAKRTYFVKVGDQMNGMTIKAIDEHGITVTYEGEETTLQ